jgi:prepilin-type N-terminal cleavage/methylation domain-containing protein
MMHKIKNRAAFTLIELLAAMAVLAIMMLMFANIFSSSGKAWTGGTRRAEQNMNGRAVLEYIGKEIGQAIANTNGLVFQVVNPAGTASYNTPNSRLNFASIVGCDSLTAPDEVRLTHYYVAKDTTDGYDNYQLIRAQTNDSTTINQAYKNTGWLTGVTGASVFVDHISQFYVVVNGGLPNYNSPPSTPPQPLPQYVDLIIGFLSEEDARKASLMSPSLQINYVATVEKRFTRRVYLQNRTGYLPVQ